MSFAVCSSGHTFGNYDFSVFVHARMCVHVSVGREGGVCVCVRLNAKNDEAVYETLEAFL